MLRIFHNTKYDFIKWWKVAAISTVAFMGIGLASFAVTGGVNYSVEFTGGTLVQLKFDKPAEASRIRSALDAAGIKGAEVQQYGAADEYTIRAQDEALVASQDAGAEKVADRIGAALSQSLGADTYRIVRTESIGPRVGEELSRNALVAMVLVSLATLIYLAFRFEWRFGVAAVVATLHDTLITIAFIKLLHLEVSLTVVAAILTLLGYSMNDTIIIFDRVRENMKTAGKVSQYDLLNRSINDTLPRSIMTHATTFAASLALLLFAGEVIRPFAWVMTFGIFVATFSSIYVAGPVLLWIEQKFPRKAASGSAARSDSAAKRPGAVATR
ncbi:MAG TPA: protein translocase subunit SecF [Gemmatimonadaceae bacterium]|nr:protein translocase subunit SecF [Gemmatimonadaceae bacterium]